jgi:hypothetical protein
MGARRPICCKQQRIYKPNTSDRTAGARRQVGHRRPGRQLAHGALQQETHGFAAPAGSGLTGLGIKMPTSGKPEIGAQF